VDFSTTVQGSFDAEDPHVPRELNLFLRTLLYGDKVSKDDDKKQMCMRSVADHILNRMVRRTKEMGNSLEKSATRQHEQLPLQLGVDLTVHHLTRSK
jgi:hypothetical protein